MNKGQRLLQPTHEYTVHNDGLHVALVASGTSQLLPFRTEATLLFVTVHGIPSNGRGVIVGNRQVGVQPVSVVTSSDLPANVRSQKEAEDHISDTTTTSNSGSTSFYMASIVGGIVATIAALNVVVALIDL
ncbi:hypothetical protein M378DRAFT_11895 [Amanita muscaria Koide BX008]|uniref:Uncharacterized protein n=1 Tax=Amanita muscaria (strain Koide BX008) TaxID=946122 RepID=A0A0C2SKP8_AMAMK|nr:hypothetical protein M378DRAFT_11895 [Amanita muscaria Koide BX008]